MARETQDYTPLQRQTTNNQTNLHAIAFTYSDFPYHFKVVDGCVKEGKRLMKD